MRYLDNKSFIRNKIKILFFITHEIGIVLLLLLASNRTFAKTYYADSNNGSNNNTGLSPLTAWKTINKINSFSFTSGDTISFKTSLRYSEFTLALHTNNLTITSYGTGDKPVLDGQGVRNCVTLEDNKNIQFYNLKFVNGFPRDIELNGCNNIIINSCNVDSCAGTSIYHQNIYSGQGTKLIIRYSTISYAGAATGGGHGIYIDGTDRTLLEFDTLLSNKNDNIRIGYGYNTPYYTDNLVIRYCIVKYAGDENISDDGSRNSEFYFNVIENDTSGWSVNISLFEQNGYSPKENLYLNNTFIIHDFGKDNAGFFIHASKYITNMHVLNNIFYLPNAQKGWAIYNQEPNPLNWKIDHNLYYSFNGSQNHVWYLKGYRVLSFMNWRKLGFDKNGIYKNPLFKDYDKGDYTLQKNSPAIKSGIQNEIKKDGRGTAIPETSPDIGAFQSSPIL